MNYKKENGSCAEVEKSVGSFNVDILAEDMSGNSVVIENQLEKTDHDHLGKLVTYSANLEAKTAIWITSDPRQEHITAITWLNEYTPISFYLLKVEAIKIGESEPAPLFYKIVGPSEDSKDIGSEKAKLSERHYKRKEFWSLLLKKSKDKTSLFSSISPVTSNWIATGIGLTGLSLQYVITYDGGTVELYIDRGPGSEEINKKRFDYLYSKKHEIENNLKTELEWERLDNRRACRIKKSFSEAGLGDEDKWDELQDNMINFMIIFEKEFRKYVPALRKIVSETN
ncbi:MULTISPECIES: DUF4268 domain-containing protein [Tepidanaerobacter]|uniref:DUF4268 domain-containing protein n=1 Tax=Tepidanaerobacter TaxID=499228 RepID=UPI001FD52E34|nr:MULTISPECIES: DUF4268 domain-containing protein [Tepidanaerobacter]